MSTKTYRVRGIDLEHDGKRFPEGSQIDLDDQAATKLKRFLEPVYDTAEAEKAEAEKASSKGGKK